ncbi:MAG: hypothetical protein WC291_10165 [Thermodesulfovibrionales bacterium]|jgi:YD repeat-containing protein
MKNRMLTVPVAAMAVLALWGSAFGVTATYTYDSLNRITKADYGNGLTEEFTYDAAGNRLSLLVPSSTLSVKKAGTGKGTVKSTPAGINCGADCVQAYALGTVITLTQTPVSGYSFSGWSGACTGAGQCKVTMNKAKTVTATFTSNAVASAQPQSASPSRTVAATTAPISVSFQGRQLMVNSAPFTIRGVLYSPIPIGSDPEAQPPYGDYFSSAYTTIHDRDLPLLRDMGANTLSLRLSDIAADHTSFLDKAYNGGVSPISVIAGYRIGAGQDIDPLSSGTVREKIKADFRQMVSVHKNHPAILLWTIEADQGYDPDQLFSLINEMAAEAHNEEGASAHPVTANLSGDKAITTIIAYDSKLSSLDAWGITTYRGSSFGTLFSDYKTASTKPLVITGFGIDAYDSAKKDEYERTGTPAQADYAKQLWSEIAANADLCFGGVVTEYSDEWWKGKYASAACPDGAAQHGVCGNADKAQPDGTNNAEWWGIVRLLPNGSDLDSVEPRTVYYTLKGLWTVGK